MNGFGFDERSDIGVSFPDNRNSQFILEGDEDLTEKHIWNV